MPTSMLLKRLGIFIINDFIQASECASLCHEMHAADTTQAEILKESLHTECLDEKIRQTQYCQISDSAQNSINQRLMNLKPALERHFQTPLADDFEHAKFLKYNKGDFFSPHTDAQYQRKINITINLNSAQSATSELGFTGGELRLYGLIQQAGFANKGIAAPAHAGCLIAYPVDIVHEVTPITQGKRLSIVSRFLSKA